MQPLIGLSTYREQARWGVWDQPADLLPTQYADAVTRAGGVPVLLPPQDPAHASAVVAGTAPTRTRARSPGAPTGTPGSWRCSTPRTRVTCRCSVCAGGCR